MMSPHTTTTNPAPADSRASLRRALAPAYRDPYAAAGDAECMYTLGNRYNEGASGVPKDQAKAAELWKAAAALGAAYRKPPRPSRLRAPSAVPPAPRALSSAEYRSVIAEPPSFTRTSSWLLRQRLIR